MINDYYLSDEYYGETVLHMAISNEDPATVKFLLDSGANVHQRCCGNFFTPEDQKNTRSDSLDHEWVDVALETNYEGWVAKHDVWLGFVVRANFFPFTSAPTHDSSCDKPSPSWANLTMLTSWIIDQDHFPNLILQLVSSKGNSAPKKNWIFHVVYLRTYGFEFGWVAFLILLQSMLSLDLFFTTFPNSIF